MAILLLCFRWDQAKPASVSNLILLTFKEVKFICSKPLVKLVLYYMNLHNGSAVGWVIFFLCMFSVSGMRLWGHSSLINPLPCRICIITSVLWAIVCFFVFLGWWARVKDNWRNKAEWARFFFTSNEHTEESWTRLQTIGLCCTFSKLLHFHLYDWALDLKLSFDLGSGKNRWTPMALDLWPSPRPSHWMCVNVQPLSYWKGNWRSFERATGNMHSWCLSAVRVPIFYFFVPILLTNGD